MFPNIVKIWNVPEHSRTFPNIAMFWNVLGPRRRVTRAESGARSVRAEAMSKVQEAWADGRERDAGGARKTSGKVTGRRQDCYILPSLRTDLVL